MLDQDLLERISKLEALVDSLCVGACGWKDNPGLYTVIKNKALYRGQVVLREAEARNRLKELQQEQAILLEDYPSLREQA